ncbi:Cation efflux system protein CusB precursor [Serratia rubidaea]|nr:Cation efflux system protein CusB precursor [Serratia rubidaea]
MKMRFNLALLAALAAGAGAGYWLATPPSSAPTGSATPAAERQVLYWYDPMVPGQRFDKPGPSPFMDMDLVPRYADEVQEQGGVTISARQQQNLGVRTAAVELRPLAPQLEAYGSVAIDERGVQVIAARASGLVEKLWVRASQQQVKKGQALAQLWIPAWHAAQQEYLAVRRLGDSALSAAARQRLQLQFMPESVIREVERSGRPQTRITVTAPASGFINSLDVREGAQVSAAQGLFELATLDRVWMVIDYPQAQAGVVQVGDAVSAGSASWPGERFSGTIDELLPNVDPLTRTFKARVQLQNPQQRLKPGMYLQVRLSQPAAGRPVPAIPLEALIMSGDRNRVLVSEGDGYFIPVEVETGRQQDGWVEITRGLKAGQRVVTAGQFLIDSEASLRSALPQLTAEKEPHDRGAHQPPAAAMAHGEHSTPQAHGEHADHHAHGGHQ